MIFGEQRLPNNNNSRDIIDPYVKLDLHGVGSDNKQGLYKTRTVLDNGFNPVFNNGRGETFAFEIYDPDSAILRIIAMDEDVGQDDFIGACSVPVSVLRAGYRHVPLLDEYNTAVRQAGILCRPLLDEYNPAVRQAAILCRSDAIPGDGRLAHAYSSE
ncbi:C2 domain-containing protein [Baffinella frigidus]|nr:C2 domain-containing protein [Cryptophyta sp. CCMP2293]